MKQLSDERLQSLSDEILAIGACARAWAGEARILGNIRADTIYAACVDTLTLIELEQKSRQESSSDEQPQ